MGLYLWGMLHEGGHEATGNAVYDTFMGVLRHPRCGHVHLKMLYDIRLPWALVFFVSLSCALRQARDEGFISASSWFMVVAHFLYANATHKVRAASPLALFACLCLRTHADHLYRMSDRWHRPHAAVREIL